MGIPARKQGFCALAPHQHLPALGMHEEQAQKFPVQDDLLPSKPASAQPGEPNLPGVPLHELQAMQIIIKKK